jgi:hypothetical protein
MGEGIMGEASNQSKHTLQHGKTGAMILCCY